jgi:hypothetical protein
LKREKTKWKFRAFFVCLFVCGKEVEEEEERENQLNNQSFNFIGPSHQWSGPNQTAHVIVVFHFPVLLGRILPNFLEHICRLPFSLNFEFVTTPIFDITVGIIVGIPEFRRLTVIL